MLQVKIIGCWSSGFWYKNEIGKIYDVKKVHMGQYRVMPKFNNGLDEFYIREDDAVVFNRREKLEKIIEKINENSNNI